MSDRKEEKVSPERIEGFLDYLAQKGRGRSSLMSYRRILTEIYRYLPEDKCITQDTGIKWRTFLEEQCFSPATINTRMSVWNSFLLYLGRREWQLESFIRGKGHARPELSRREYLRLLSAARQMGREKSYLLIKTLGGAGMRVQELPQLTVEAVERGMVKLEYHNSRQKRVLYLPKGLREELMDYIGRECIKHGAVFTSPEGMPMTRTNVNYFVGAVSREAKVAENKATPRCLWNMYQKTCEEIQTNVTLLVEQIYQKMLDEEQEIMGWKA